MLTCPDGQYGHSCLQRCTTCKRTDCHHVYGCNTTESSTLILSSIKIQTTLSPFTREKIDISSASLTQSSLITTTSAMVEKNMSNNIILVVGCAITLCLVIIIIQGVHKQILKSKRKRRSTVKQEEMAEIYSEIEDRAFVGRPNVVNRHEEKSTNDRNKYNVLINCESELPGRGYQEINEIPEISDRADVKSQGATDSDSNGESYLEPNEQGSAHTYTKVIDSDDERTSPSSTVGCENYLDPVLEVTPRMHAHLCKPVLSDYSENSEQYQDTALPLGYGRGSRNDQNGHTSDRANVLYLDVTNS
ncbi:uncharacterized protein LOC130051842 isoform X2 [Ostrea edulis]|nr:uncharacterized protein LOC130051842 isoform X2 [Ostrea edulis]